jgi:uncharacterized integral membrane protein
MNHETNAQSFDNSAPAGLMVIPAVVGGLIWMCAMLARFGSF